MEQKTYALGQRYIGAGQSEGTIILNEVPGNALGAYLDGANIIVNCSAQDATGDTMNAGEITIHGSTGDAAGYAMRGGAIYVQGDAGYRAGIHMKEYKEKVPVLVIGGRTGSFLGEYQAGGIIIVLGIGSEDRQPVGNFCGTGMHGGEIYLRCGQIPTKLPAQVRAEKIERLPEDAAELVREWCREFGQEEGAFVNASYFRLTPNSDNPYRQMYTVN